MGLHLDASFPVLQGKQELPAPHSRSSSDVFSGLDPVTGRSLLAQEGPLLVMPFCTDQGVPEDRDTCPLGS